MEEVEAEIQLTCLSGTPSSDSESEGSSSDSDSSDSDSDSSASENDSWMLAACSQALPRRRRRQLHHQTQKELNDMYAKCYEASRKGKKKPPPQLPFILHHAKLHHPEVFCQEFHVTPYTFDCLIQCIEHDHIFMSGSDNGQMPVETQLGITLYRFGHYGNAAGLSKVARWAGVGKGTVLLATKRVMRALVTTMPSPTPMVPTIISR
ncbi:hypothetical protein DFJ43DRAFT_721192 [Lentinula guzmanii]|uniref:Uncharacterized protein n=1 Tax=Lentinula guzmanii TaxID=2804957 RepID=A0AA38JJB0_9AGAR|nr:hypothetical protein DFJ43DRAFT_721192 [Lentinula guzmanii]